MAEYHVGALQAYSTIQAALNAALAPGDIVTVHGGIYNEFVVSKAASVTVRGISGASVVIDGTGQSQETVRFTHSNCALKNVRVVSPVDKYALSFYTGTNFLFEDVFLDVKHTGVAAYKSATFNRCTMINYKSSGIEFTVATAGMGVSDKITFNFCRFLMHRGIDVRSGAVELNHCVSIASYGSAVDVFPNDTVKSLRIINCCFTYCNIEASASSVIRNRSTGNEVVEIGGTVIVASMMNPTTPFVIGNYIDLGGNKFGTEYPGLRDLGYNALVSVEVDDAVNLPTFTTLAEKLEAYGWRGTYQIDTANISDWSPIHALHNKGHEIASHTRRHVNLGNMAAFTIRHNSLACTMTIDTQAMTLTTSQGLSLNMSSYANVGALVAAINTNTEYTAVSTQSLPTNYSSLGIPYCLSDVSAVDIHTAVYTASYDRTKLYAEEIDGSLADLVANIPGFDATTATLCSPGHFIDATGEQYLYENGWLGARKGTNSESLRTGNLDFFHIYGVQPSLVTGDMRRDLMKHIERARFEGRVLCIYFHGISGGEWPNGWDGVDLFLSELKKSGATVLPRRDALLQIKSTATQSGKTYAQAPRDYDLRIMPESRLVHGGAVITGVNDGAQTDPWGNTMLTYPNIGADQYDYAPGFGPWATLTAPLPTSAQPCKGHALPIGVGKVTVFPGVASASQINEAKE